jgi:small conductance mechanosensitive channel
MHLLSREIMPFVPLGLVVIGSLFMLWLFHWLLIGRHGNLENERRFPRQLIMLGLGILCLVAVIVVLPIPVNIRNQLIALIGFLLSGILAFSSTTLFANLMAGILLRTTRPFRIGDFIRVKEFFGRVAERGLFDTEIQSENRELVAIPNTVLITNPVTTIRSSGTIVSATVSLGYDIHHAVAEPLFIAAATKTGLDDPYVHILELGNHAVTYRIAGFLSDVKGYLSVKSELCRQVLDALHGQGLEIMTPSIMNQRPMASDQRVIPAMIETRTQEQPSTPESIVFDKAEEAERLERRKQLLLESIKSQEEMLKAASEDDKRTVKKRLEQLRTEFEDLEKTPENKSRG